VTRRAQQPLEGELEPEKEEQEDHAELGHELGHLGRPHHREDLRLVRPEQQAREQVGRDGGEPEAARDEAESAEQRDGHGELRQRHPVRG
jgi:hypothetical protein